MEEFFLSRNTNFDFKLFGFQHLFTIGLTILVFIIIYKYKNEILMLKYNKIKRIRYIFAFIILINMLLYRGSYIFYGVYDIKVHLSLYYCHIVNYLFVFALFIDYKPLYKVVYGLLWIGAFWTILFPDVSGGIDCFIFYSSFISHNLVLIFITFMSLYYNLKINFYDVLKSLFYCFCIFGITYVINYDFGTDYNSPNSILGNYINASEFLRYLLLLFLGLIGSAIGFFVNKIYSR